VDCRLEDDGKGSDDGVEDLGSMTRVTVAVAALMMTATTGVGDVQERGKGAG
jgi:hypothetical protein